MYPREYTPDVFEIHRTDEFDEWLRRLRDRRARARILTRIARLTLGNPGDARSVGGGIRELRIAHGPGYRVYYMMSGEQVVILLAGGDKATQAKDIAQARQLAEQIGRGEPL